MKLGLGLYAGQATPDNLQYACQLGVTHIVQHLPGEETLPSTRDGVWSVDDLKALRRHIASHGLVLEAIENFPPSFWDQVLLGGPGRDRQLENLKQTIENLGQAGIPTMGYYFSLAGVWGRVKDYWARGEAETVGYVAELAPEQTPLPHGEVWGQQVDPNPPEGNLGQVTHEEMWARLACFLEAVVPVAEEVGVRLAAHPDDPPLAELRGTARLLTHPDHYQRLLDLVPSDSNLLEFCQGTITEMVGVDPLEAIWRFARQNKIAYVHFRNVRGKVPNYHEVFIDEGDADMLEAVRAYHLAGYEGVLIPDHTPAVTCAAPWHAGMAFAVGYMRALMTAVERLASGS